MYFCELENCVIATPAPGNSEEEKDEKDQEDEKNNINEKGEKRGEGQRR